MEKVQLAQLITKLYQANNSESRGELEYQLNELGKIIPITKSKIQT